MTPQKKATVVASIVATVLTLLKLTVGIISGSVSVLASAVDSVLDTLISLFNYFAVSNSEKPADNFFNYGRGKIEAIASVVEGSIIAVSGLFLLYEAFKKAILGETSQYISISIVVMGISLLITIGLVLYLNSIAKKTDSMIIKADALHYKTDVYSNLAVLLSLVLVKFTSLELIDVIIGSAIAIYIIYSAYGLIKDGILILLDRAVSKDIVEKIVNILEEECIKTYHLLKTRQAGNITFVEVHLVFDKDIKLYDAHSISDKIEIKIKNIDKKRDWEIITHLDPYDDFNKKEK